MQKITEILARKITANSDKIESWFEKSFEKHPALFYNSVDLRHSGFKIAPIDTNCFPAGFNNLSEISKQRAKSIADEFLKRNFPDAKNILIIPENHTRNLRYLENVRVLQEIISDSRQVVVGTLIEEIEEVLKIDLENGNFLELHPLKKEGNEVKTQDGFTADLAILNNDLTDGIPDLLKGVSLPIIPSEKMGWHSRAKSEHFTIYNKLVKDFCEIIDLDPWLISSMHRFCKNVSFKEKIGIEDLAKNVDELIDDLRKKYKEYDIQGEPYCYIKADSGTYGMAVLPVFSGADVLEINKKQRNKMSMLKGSVKNSSVMIQEGIKTVDRISDQISEPMIYMVAGKVVGNLFRVNEGRDEKISLNAAGAIFPDLENLLSDQVNIGGDKSEITSIYSIISRIAALASSIEYHEVSL